MVYWHSDCILYASNDFLESGMVDWTDRWPSRVPWPFGGGAVWCREHWDSGELWYGCLLGLWVGA